METYLSDCDDKDDNDWIYDTIGSNITYNIQNMYEQEEKDELNTYRNVILWHKRRLTHK